MTIKNAVGVNGNDGKYSIENHVKSSGIANFEDTPRSFEYNLTDKAAKAKLIKAARRTTPLTVEENTSSSNLVFSAGAWQNAVGPAVRYWNQEEGDKTCKLGEYTVNIGGIKAGVEKSGK